MIRAVLAPFIFVLHTSLQSSPCVVGGLIILLGLVKLIMPNGKIKQHGIKYGLMFSFGRVSVLMIRCSSVILSVRYGELSKDRYPIIANHLSYLDIILLIEFATNRIPAPKFSLRKAFAAIFGLVPGHLI